VIPATLPSIRVDVAVAPDPPPLLTLTHFNGAVPLVTVPVVCVGAVVPVIPVVVTI